MNQKESEDDVSHHHRALLAAMHTSISELFEFSRDSNVVHQKRLPKNCRSGQQSNVTTSHNHKEDLDAYYRESSSKHGKRRDSASPKWDDENWASVMMKHMEESSRAMELFEEISKQFSIFDDESSRWQPVQRAKTDFMVGCVGSAPAQTESLLNDTMEHCHVKHWGIPKQITGQFFHDQEQAGSSSPGADAYSRLIGYHSSDGMVTSFMNDHEAERKDTHHSRFLPDPETPKKVNTPLSDLFQSNRNELRQAFTSQSIHIFTQADGSVIRKKTVTRVGADGAQLVDESSEELISPYSFQERFSSQVAHPESGSVAAVPRLQAGKGWFWST